MVMIGNRIRKRREELGYTREQFAEMLDVSPKFCIDFENGAKGLSLKTLIKISSILHLSTDYILKGTDKESIENPFVAFAQDTPSSEAIHYYKLCQVVKDNFGNK